MDSRNVVRLVPQSEVEWLRERANMLDRASNTNSDFLTGEAVGIEMALAALGLDESEESAANCQ
jgi:hypothetical protein